MIYTIHFSYYDIDSWRPSHGHPGKESTLSFDVVASSEYEAEQIAHKIFIMSFGKFNYKHNDPKDYGCHYNTVKLPWEVQQKGKQNENRKRKCN